MATLTLRNVPDDLVARLKLRAKQHRRSLNSETIASLELADAAAAGLAASQLLQGLDRDAALARITELQARFTKTAKQPPQRRTAAELQAELDSFSQLRRILSDSSDKRPPTPGHHAYRAHAAV